MIYGQHSDDVLQLSDGKNPTDVERNHSFCVHKKSPTSLNSTWQRCAKGQGHVCKTETLPKAREETQPER